MDCHSQLQSGIGCWSLSDSQDAPLMTGFLFDWEIFEAAAARRVAGITGAYPRLCLTYYEVTYGGVLLCF